MRLIFCGLRVWARGFVTRSRLESRGEEQETTAHAKQKDVSEVFAPEESYGSQQAER
jgi:hypothetical protein